MFSSALSCLDSVNVYTSFRDALHFHTRNKVTKTIIILYLDFYVTLMAKDSSQLMQLKDITFFFFYQQITAQWESTLVSWPKSEVSSSTDSRHLNKEHLLVL